MGEAIPVVAKIIAFIWAGLVTVVMILAWRAINVLYRVMEKAVKCIEDLDDTQLYEHLFRRITELEEWRGKHGGGV